jgi:hypothetical protein
VGINGLGDVVGSGVLAGGTRDPDGGNGAVEGGAAPGNGIGPVGSVGDG